jgi:hypothetical protein
MAQVQESSGLCEATYQCLYGWTFSGFELNPYGVQRLRLSG